MLGIIGLAVTIFINIGTLAYSAGTLTTRIAHGEEMMRDMRQKVEAFNTLTNEMTGVKAELRSINTTLQRLESQLNKGSK